MIKKITAFEAMDGKVFRTEDEAKSHDTLLTFEMPSFLGG